MSSTTTNSSDVNNYELPKRYYYRLESESSRASDDDTESVCSAQGLETELVRDTSDTDTKSEYEVEIEYTSSDKSGYSSSATEGMVIAAAVAFCDNSLETWITDCEDSDTSLPNDGTFAARSAFWTCLQCKSRNNNPYFRYCLKCFQDRKTSFPPRPRPHKKPKPVKHKYKFKTPVKLDIFRNCLSGLSSQDSGIGSSQECPSLDLDKIVVPKHLSSSTASTNDTNYSEISTVSYVSLSEPSTSKTITNRKRKTSDSSLSENEKIFTMKAKRSNEIFEENKCNLEILDKSNVNKVSDEEVKSRHISKANNVDDSDEKAFDFNNQKSKELCLMCNNIPVNSIFIHGKYGHMCCCYKCATRTWKKLKRCPVCNRQVNNVVKVYS